MATTMWKAKQREGRNRTSICLFNSFFAFEGPSSTFSFSLSTAGANCFELLKTLNPSTVSFSNTNGVKQKKSAFGKI